MPSRPVPAIGQEPLEPMESLTSLESPAPMDPPAPRIPWADRMPGPAIFVLVAVTYFGLAQFVIRLNDPVNLGAGFWPAAGVSLGMLLLLPTRRWVWVLAAVALTELVSDLYAGYPLGASLLWSAANTVEPLVGAVLIRRFGHPHGLLSPVRHFLAFLALGVVVGPLVGGTVGTIGTVAGLGTPVWQVWPKFVVGDALGVLVIAPMLLTWNDRTAERRRTPESLLLAFSLVTVTFLVFRNWSGGWDLTLPYLIMPLLVWSALRYGVRVTAWSVFFVAQVANWATAVHYGPFAIAGGPQGHAITLLQVFLAITAATGLVVAALVRELSSREEVEQLLAHQAAHDPLTALPNRFTFVDELNRALTALHGGDRHLAVLFCDLDRFKLINDRLGHETGDALLLEVAQRLGGVSRSDDVVSRFGGDEFVILCRNLTTPEAAAQIAERLVRALGEPFVILGRTFTVSASVGIAVTNDPDARADDLLRDADVAMYRAKSRGPGRFEFLDAELRQQTLERHTLENELRDALHRDELRLLYQPIVEIRTGRIIGAEALLRWQHPTRGLLAPNAFLEVAESTGLILPIGDWILATAAQDACAWPEDTFVSVNVSPRQLVNADHEDLVSAVQQICDRTGLAPSRLWLEVVEGAIGDIGTSADILQHLRALGVHIAMDDFGTGYSSISRLRTLPFDVCKLDMSFVQQLGKAAPETAVVRAITEISHAYGMRVVAEGVETAHQLDHLAAFGCDFAQGFHLHRPMSEPDLRTLFASSLSQGSPALRATTNGARYERRDSATAAR